MKKPCFVCLKIPCQCKKPPEMVGIPDSGKRPHRIAKEREDSLLRIIEEVNSLPSGNGLKLMLSSADDTAIREIAKKIVPEKTFHMSSALGLNKKQREILRSSGEPFEHTLWFGPFVAPQPKKMKEADQRINGKVKIKGVELRRILGDAVPFLQRINFSAEIASLLKDSQAAIREWDDVIKN